MLLFNIKILFIDKKVLNSNNYSDIIYLASDDKMRT
jgi:hypothetical protein